jgi:hypothetical protein
MALSISESLSVQLVTAKRTADLSVPAPVPTHNSQQTPAYTVVLSQAAQANQLSAQGQTPSAIAAGLGISLSNANLDLGFVAAKPAESQTNP